MKTPAAIITLFFLLLFVYTKLAGPLPFSVTSTTTTKSDTFNVTGIGKVVATPDIATVSVGVQAQGSTVKAIQENINTTINKVTGALKKLGIDEGDIQTTNYSIYPDYDYLEGRQRIRGYTANTNITVTVRDIDKTNEVIDIATENGANQVGGITFDVDDKTKVQNVAREEAVAEAKRKASDAARIAGFTLGRIVNYSESFGGEPYPVPLYSRAVSEAAEGVPTQVEPGSTEIAVSVTLSFEIH